LEKIRVSSTDVLKRIKEKRTMILPGNNTTETRLCWTCYKRGSSGRNASVILEGKIKGKKAKGRPRLKTTWFDDVRLIQMKLNEVLRIMSLAGPYIYNIARQPSI